MKKMISLLSALALIASLAVSPAYADNAVFEETLSMTQGNAVTENIASYGFTGDTVVEIEYDFTNSAVPEDKFINVPFVFKNAEGTEVARLAITGDGDISNTDYLRTRFEYVDENGKAYNSGDLCSRTGFVEKKGKLTFLFSNTDRKLYAQYKGETLKTDGYMGYAPFTYTGNKTDGYTPVDTATGLGQITIGASASPAGSLKVKAYSAEDAAQYKIPYAKYTYETSRVGLVHNLFAPSGTEIPMDFKNTAQGVEIKEDSSTGNHYLYVPAGKQYELMFAPQNRAIESYSDYTFIKWKQRVASEAPTFSGTKSITSGPYPGSITSLTMTAENKLKFKNTVVTVPSLTDDWVEIMQVYNPKKGNVSLYVNNDKYATESYNVQGLNTMIFNFDNDMYIDDLEMGAYTPTLADQTFNESYEITSGQSVDKNISDYVTSNQMIVEVMYNMDNADESKLTGNLNIPIILRSNTAELGRFSIQDNTAAASSQYFQTNFGQVNLQNLGGLVGKSGTIKILADFYAQKYYVKYIGTGLKTEQYMGWGALNGSDLTTVRIGAGGNPGISVTTKAYPADANAVKEFKSFKTIYKYDDVTYSALKDSYLDFKATNAGVSISNGAVSVPKGKLFSIMLTPQNKGYEGKFVIKYKIKNAGNGEFSNNSVYVTNYGDSFGATRTQTYETRIGFAGLQNTSSIFPDSVEYGNMPYKLFGDWIEFKQVIDLENHTADLYADGWFCVSKTLNASTQYVNNLQFKFDDCDVLIDDISVETYTDETVKNTVKLYVGKLENGDWRVSASYVDVNAADSETVSVIAASYNGNELENAALLPILNKSTAGVTISEANVKTIKGFMWKDGNLQPLCGAVTEDVAAQN